MSKASLSVVENGAERSHMGQVPHCTVLGAWVDRWITGRTIWLQATKQRSVFSCKHGV